MTIKALILYLEDEPGQQKLFRLRIPRLLEPGEDILLASDVDDAIEQVSAREEKPNLFIVDLNMEGSFQGKDFIAWIRNKKSWNASLFKRYEAIPEIRESYIVAFTSSDRNSDREDCESLRVNQFQVKPPAQSESEYVGIFGGILKECRNLDSGGITDTWGDRMERKKKL